MGLIHVETLLTGVHQVKALLKFALAKEMGSKFFHKYGSIKTLRSFLLLTTILAYFEVA